MTPASDSGARRGDLAIALGLLAAAVLYFGQFVHYGVSLADEGSLLAQFARLARGETLYLDFRAGYTPGVYALHAAVMRALGPDLVPGRWLRVAVPATAVARLFRLMRRLGVGRGFALLAAVAYASSPPVHAGEFASANWQASASTSDWLPSPSCASCTSRTTSRL